MILKLGMNHQLLKVYKVDINDDLFHGKVKFGQNCLNQTNSQVSIYRTNGPLVFNIAKSLADLFVEQAGLP